ncbi:TPA: hypothetical protein NHU67_001614 [Citrobacter freundii]|uniref:putative zinc ribbon protein n=1 Tax=Enterobacter sp. TaxID=42895 RepID=UPI00296E7587|nr:putative zinc ribbon protein [Enterobacter sp.]HCE8851226.1 hypothetical protein [Citrobacter freundii]
MFAKSFIALDGNGRLTGARTAQTAPYDRYTCHLCGSALNYHPEYDTHRPWFEHATPTLTENGLRHCPYVLTDEAEAIRIGMLRHYVAGANPVVGKTHWHCGNCESDFHAESYCLNCRTGEHCTERQTR